jgi:hypothetical protein
MNKGTIVRVVWWVLWPRFLFGIVSAVIPDVLVIYSYFIEGTELPRLTQVIIWFPHYFWLCAGFTVGVFNAYNFIQLKRPFLSVGIIFSVMVVFIVNAVALFIPLIGTIRELT